MPEGLEVNERQPRSFRFSLLYKKQFIYTQLKFIGYNIVKIDDSVIRICFYTLHLPKCFCTRVICNRRPFLLVFPGAEKGQPAVGGHSEHFSPVMGASLRQCC